MPKIFINKSDVNSTLTPVGTRAIDDIDLKKSIEKSAKLDINELVSKDPILPAKKGREKSHEEILAELYETFDSAVLEMTQQETKDFYNRVKLEVVFEDDIEELVKKRALFIDTNEVCMITSKRGHAGSAAIGKTKFPLINSAVTRRAIENQMFSMWWMPTMQPTSTQLIARHFVTHVEGPLGWKVELLNDMRYRYTIYLWDRLDEIMVNYSITTTAETSARLNQWNYISFGVFDSSIYFKVNDQVALSQPFEKNMSNYNDIKYGFTELWNPLAEMGPTGYSETGTILDELYWVYPQLIFGGIDVTDDSSNFGKFRNPLTTEERREQPANQVVQLNSPHCRSIKDGLSSYYLSTFRCYLNLPINQVSEDRFVEDLDTNSNLKTANVLDVRFDKIQNDEIRDYSKNANLVVLTGDMNPLIAQDRIIFTEKKRPSLVSTQGPF